MSEQPGGAEQGNIHKSSEEQPQSLQVIDFDTKPAHPQKYIFPSPVTRDNFASALVTSFGISRGEEKRQILYFELIKAHTGFDYNVNIQGFLDQGGWNILSQDEQDKFTQSFDSVKGHRNETAGEVFEGFHENPTGVLSGQLDGVLNPEYSVEDLIHAFEEKYGPLHKQRELKTFLRNLNESHPKKVIDLAAYEDRRKEVEEGLKNINAIIEAQNAANETLPVSTDTPKSTNED